MIARSTAARRSVWKQRLRSGFLSIRITNECQPSMRTASPEATRTIAMKGLRAQTVIEPTGDGDGCRLEGYG